MNSTEQPKRGWWWAPGTRKAHYYEAGQAKSLCTRYMSFLADVIAHEANDTGDDSPDNCAACVKMVAKLRKREAVQ